jgi:hypothetical protein
VVLEELFELQDGRILVTDDLIDPLDDIFRVQKV